MFATNGIVCGVWGGSLPLIRDRVGLTATQLPALLFAAGIFSLISMQVSGRLSDRLGARTIAVAALPFLIAATIVLGLAGTLPLTVLGVALLGIGNGGMNLAMNAYGSQVELARHSPIMSFFHATWSFGNFAGALLVLAGGRLFGSAVPVRALLPVMGSAALLAAVAWGGLARYAPASPPIDHRDETGVRRRIPRAAWLLGIMAIVSGLAEGTAFDWSSIHVRDVTGVPAATAALGLTMMSAAMVAIRLIGDRLVAGFGRRTVVRGGGLCAGAGYLLVAFTGSLPPILAGWALVGFGVGMISPQVYAVAGRLGGGRVMAVVSTFGYTTFLAGPAVTGWIIHQVGISHAMLLPGALCLALLVLAAALPKQD